MAVSAIATGARMTELRGAGGSGGNSTSTGAPTVPRGDSQSIVFRLTKNESHDHRDREQDRFEAHRQPHRPPD